jgi:hypothetical protein
MKKIKNPFTILAQAGVILAVSIGSATAQNWKSGMTEGSPAIKSMGPLAFGPEGILLVGDSKSAAVFAVATDDTKSAGEESELVISNINTKVAALLGVMPDQILIEDIASNPLSNNVYISVSRGRGPEAKSVLVRAMAESGKLEVVDLGKVWSSKATLPNAPEDREIPNRRGSYNPRMESITDVSYMDGRVLIAGLSNEEFSSTLNAVPFPFDEIDKGAQIEIYHGAHGKFETRSPIRTLTPMMVGGEPQLIAAYTCTPLVQIPMKQIKAGGKIMGKTIAELGNRNRPLDMITYKRGDQDYILMANSSRGVMKINASNIEEAEKIESPVSGGGVKGLAFQTLEPLQGVMQLDRFGSSHAVILEQVESGAQHLKTIALP